MMRITSTNRDYKLTNNLKITALQSTFRSAAFFLLIAFVLYQPITLNAQIVQQPLSDISTSIKKYVFTYNLSGTSKKEIRYIIIKSSTGEVKSCFDACDVCYAANKGYSQKGTQLVCNNCGNKFNIDGLGSQGTGGCWPGHLVHSLFGDNVEFNVADIEAGAYLFPLLATDVSEIQNNQIPIYIDNNKVIRFNQNNLDIKEFQIFTLNGTLCKTWAYTPESFSINISDLPSGIYFIISDFDGKAFINKFNISR